MTTNESAPVDVSLLFLSVEPDSDEQEQIDKLLDSLAKIVEEKKVDKLDTVMAELITASSHWADHCEVTQRCWNDKCFEGCETEPCHEKTKDPPHECCRVVAYGDKITKELLDKLSDSTLKYVLIVLEEFGCTKMLMQFITNAIFKKINQMPENERRDFIDMATDTEWPEDQAVREIIKLSVAEFHANATGGSVKVETAPAAPINFDWEEDDDNATTGGVKVATAPAAPINFDWDGDDENEADAK